MIQGWIIQVTLPDFRQGRVQGKQLLGDLLPDVCVDQFPRFQKTQPRGNGLEYGCRPVVQAVEGPHHAGEEDFERDVLRAKRMGRSRWLRLFPLGVQRLFQHARARVEVTAMPLKEIIFEIVSHELSSWEGHSFLAMHVADKLADQSQQLPFRRIWVFGFLVVLVLVPRVIRFLGGRLQREVVYSPLLSRLFREIIEDFSQVLRRGSFTKYVTRSRRAGSAGSGELVRSR